jgi:transposase
MVRGVLALSLSDWLNKADTAIAPEVRGFARTLRQDQAAVQTGMLEPSVEGQVNRLKLIKR